MRCKFESGKTMNIHSREKYHYFLSKITELLESSEKKGKKILGLLLFRKIWHLYVPLAENVWLNNWINNGYANTTRDDIELFRSLFHGKLCWYEEKKTYMEGSRSVAWPFYLKTLVVENKLIWWIFNQTQMVRFFLMFM